MFQRVGRFAVHRPWLTILGWVVAAVALAVLAPGLKSTTDEAEFLPKHYESVQVANLQKSAFPQTEQPASIVVFQRSDHERLTADDRRDVIKVAEGLQAKHRPEIAKVETGPRAVSPNGEIALANIVATTKDTYDKKLADSVKQLREDAKPLLGGTHLTMGITGQVATNVDSQESSGNTDAMVMSATLLLIIVLLLVIFRSPLIALLPVIIIGVVFMVAIGLIGTAASLGDLKADSSISPILIVVLFGVGTDYLLFLLFRYREHLRAGQEPKEALVAAVARVGETIASAAGAVIVAFLALLLSTMGMMRAMGPSLAIAVAVTLVAALTFVPAVFSLLGSKAFWPSKAWRKQPRNRFANTVGGLVSRRPGLVALVSAGVLAALAVGALSFRPEFDTSSQMSQKLESVQAMKDLQRGFSAGQSDPAMVYLKSTGGTRLDKAAMESFRTRLAGIEGVGQAAPGVPNSDGTVAQYSVVLKYAPTSDKAIELAGGTLRDQAHKAAPAGTRALVGGTSAVLADVKNAVDHDYTVVFPVAGIAIMVILGLLLRSLVAPWYLMAAVALGFGATLGSTVWLFQDLQGKHGLLFMLPVIMYLFVVAIGTDYNILMVARLREEARRGTAPREAIRTAVARSAPTIASAAVILAGTFGVLMLADNSMLQQMGFAVAFGILLTAFIMAMLLVPTVTSLLGHKAWWPGHQDEPVTPAPADRTGELEGVRP
ncbi:MULTISPECIES: MMPL family transporter [Streptomyces]|uniref:MMPL family transporter n=1 Tax=Streptomyces morookaense TaxID=1970 RepID=A0A7Y7B1I5_STRMO|nr:MULTISPECIES: MMPL family transporter [Streptomyces]MCC2278665.1 MMPL family transporter [Streptomyces sp. ET3-23]NVK77323.1 MMPL family transporter [Streptomyces morookaense]GHF18367.1 putative membrane protein [Streptomyces morookaense]